MLELMVELAGTLPVGLKPPLVPMEVPGPGSGEDPVMGVSGFEFTDHCPVGFRVGVVFFGGARWCFLMPPSLEWEPPEELSGLPTVYTVGNQGVLFRRWPWDAPEQLHPEVVATSGAWRIPEVEVHALEQVLGGAFPVLMDLDRPRIRRFSGVDPERPPGDPWGNSVVEHVGAALHTLATKLLRGEESRVTGRLLLQDYDGTGWLRPPTDDELDRVLLCYRRSSYQPVPSLTTRGKFHVVAPRGVHKWSEGFTYRKSHKEMEPLVWKEEGFGTSLARVRGSGVSPPVFRWTVGVMAKLGQGVSVANVPRADAHARRAAQAAAEELPGVDGNPPMRAQACMGPAETAWLDALWEWIESRQREA
jgi:hypothetical protein